MTTPPITLHPRSCPSCRSIGTPRDGCQDLWHVEVRKPVVPAPLISADQADNPQPDRQNLHERLRAELDRRLAVAKAATPGPWSADPTGTVCADADLVDDTLAPIGQGPQEVAECYREERRGERADNAAHIALHDPADAIRRYDGELEVLERHAPNQDRDCRTCLYDTLQTYQDMPIANRENWPCDEIRSLASRLGVNVDDTVTSPERSQQRDTS